MHRKTADLRLYLYLLPALIFVFGVIYVGLGYTGWVSLLDWNGLSPDQDFVGFRNFIEIATDPIFWHAMGNVLIFGVITTFVQMGIGLIMAILLQGRLVWGRGVIKVLLFIPVVLAPAVVATGFRNLLSPDGAFNQLLGSVGLTWAQQAWLANPSLALYAIIGISIWAGTGYSFVLYQAAISQIDSSLPEAAQVDGAGSFRILRYVVIPQLTGTHVILIILGFMGALKTFDLVFLTTGGGPGRQTEFLTTYIYREGVNQFHAGYSAALSIVLVLLCLAFTLIQLRVNRTMRG